MVSENDQWTVKLVALLWGTSWHLLTRHSLTQGKVDTFGWRNLWQHSTQVTTATLQTLGPCYLRPLDDRHGRISLELLPGFLPNRVDKETPRQTQTEGQSAEWVAWIPQNVLTEEKREVRSVSWLKELRETWQLNSRRDSGLDPGLENKNNWKGCDWDNWQSVNMACGLCNSIESVLKFLI